MVDWLLNLIDEGMAFSLQPSLFASDMWNHLKKIFLYANKARKSHLNLELFKYNQQRNPFKKFLMDLRLKNKKIKKFNPI